MTFEDVSILVETYWWVHPTFAAVVLFFRYVWERVR